MFAVNHVLVCGFFLRALSQGYFVVPQARPHEPLVESVCACDFGDNFWLHLIGGLLEHAPNGLYAHAPDPKLHKWLATVQCDPWPIEPLDTVVGNAVGGDPYWEDHRYGRRYHYTTSGSAKISSTTLASAWQHGLHASQAGSYWHSYAPTRRSCQP